MRVAILSSFDGREVSSLIHGLSAKGVEAVSIPLNTRETWSLFETLEHLSESFDLVHHFSELPPVYSQVLDVPVVATVERISSEHLSQFQRIQERVYYVAESGSPDSLRYFADLREGAVNLADAYHGIYQKVLELRKREDHRPWGYYTVLADEPTHKVKRICVYPGKRLSLQRHQRRCEHWHVIDGEALVTLDQAQVKLQPGQSVDIPFGAIHRIENRSEQPMAFIEVQRGDYFGEDDIERLEDDFGRVI